MTIKVKDMKLWEAFLAVAKDRSFTVAAEKLRISTPQLSKNIGILEASLNRSLFHRTTRRVSLTVDGRKLLPEIEGLFESLTQIETIGQPSEPSGHLRVTTVPAFGVRVLSKLLPKFRKLYPLVSVEVLLTDHLVDMVAEEIDIAIRTSSPTGANYIYRRWIENELVICASPNYLRKADPINEPKDLQNHPLLYLSFIENLRFKNSSISVREAAKIRPLVSENGLMLTQLILEGVGVGIRSKWDVKNYLQSKELVPLLEKYPLQNQAPFFIVTPPTKIPKKLSELFIEFLKTSYP